jgi:hypothetical protein
MRKCFQNLWIVIAVWTIGVPAFAQKPPQSPAKKSEPAPRRDLTGVWSGKPSMLLERVPEMTPWGKKFYDEARPMGGLRAVPIPKSNDPLVMCDPLGFPRNVLYELRGVEFEQVPRKTLQLFQYQRVWREIWTDGRKLATNVGASTVDAPDPRYYGYSVGEWVDDYTFVINTTGFNENAWADPLGHPRSMNARIEERYHRVDHDTLEVTVTIDDPKAYTKPFVAMNKQPLYWNRKQEFEEQLCVPSEAAEYLSVVRDAADEK